MNKMDNGTKKTLSIYAVLLLIVILLNTIVIPMMTSQQIKEVDYSTFLTMTEQKKIDQVEITSNKIIFSDKSNPKKYYKTGIVDDTGLVSRLQESGAKFGSEIVEKNSIFSSIFYYL